MDLTPYVESLRRDLMATAEVAGDDAKVVAERLLTALDSSVRLVLIDALGAAAEQVTAELAPGSVELRLRGREPEFVVSTATMPDPPAPPPPPSPPPFDGDDGATARISLRLPDGLKVRIEEAANTIGFSVNSWLVKALNEAVAQVSYETHQNIREHRRDVRPGRNLSGWVR